MVTGPTATPGASLRGHVDATGLGGPDRRAVELSGATGAVGPQEFSSSTVMRGRIASGNGWSVYRDYTFGRNGNDIGRLDADKTREIAAYIDHNPIYRTGSTAHIRRR